MLVFNFNMYSPPNVYYSIIPLEIDKHTMMVLFLIRVNERHAQQLQHSSMQKATVPT